MRIMLQFVIDWMEDCSHAAAGLRLEAAPAAAAAALACVTSRRLAAAAALTLGAQPPLQAGPAHNVTPCMYAQREGARACIGRTKPIALSSSTVALHSAAPARCSNPLHANPKPLSQCKTCTPTAASQPLPRRQHAADAAHAAHAAAACCARHADAGPGPSETRRRAAAGAEMQRVLAAGQGARDDGSAKHEVAGEGHGEMLGPSGCCALMREGLMREGLMREGSGCDLLTSSQLQQLDKQ